MVQIDTAVAAVEAAETAEAAAAAAVVVLCCWNHCFGSWSCDSLMGCHPRLSVLGVAYII